MSNLAVDLLIYLLLLTGVGFGGIALMGLLIFPDIHSRMYTALRAGLLSIAGITGAAVVYAIAFLAGSGGDLYSTFLIHAIFLLGITVVAVMVIDRQVLDKTRALVYCGSRPAPVPEPEKKEP
jgi:multicomponent Na+:H+ antiporter subunit G